MERLKIIVTAGATREYLDSVRFISNASSGLMGCEVAAAAADAHDVTLLIGAAGVPAAIAPRLEAVRIVPFSSVGDLKEKLGGLFDGCDVLVMAAAVGDFRLVEPFEGKIPRGGGAITLRLEPTEDILAGLSARKRSGQIVVAFAVEDGPREQIEAKAKGEAHAKGAECVVVNTPAAIGSTESEACILIGETIGLPWGYRPKEILAGEIVRLIEGIVA
ncbi:MAG: phosphopantothenoylcysteine decarboxylase [Phycisphaerae bacterium]|nr:phosphopantothenoylcysteine decarboxylase [Phycisphaerae bacterium]